MGVRITVLGTGYLGATHAACMADLGHDVLGVDVDLGKLAKLQAGEVPFYEPRLQDVLQRNLAAGRLRFTASYAEAAAWGEVHFLAVGTPQKRGEFSADVSALESVIDALAPRLTGPALIYGKSTVPVGTAAKLAARARELAPAGDAVELSWNPEFLREGFAVRDTLHPERLVLGVDAARPGRAESVARELYAALLAEQIPLVVTDLATAELVKVAANAFLATKISFINAISDVCEAAGADVTTLADVMGYDARIGRQFLNAGIGFGGGCLPKDIRALMARAGELGVGQTLAFLREVDSVNTGRRAAMVERTRNAVGGSLLGARIAVLGAAFKPNSDDVRDSPAINVAGQMQLYGAEVSVYEGDGELPAGVSDAELRGVGPRRLRASRRRAHPHRVGRVHRALPAAVGRPGSGKGHHRRPQLSGPRAVAAARLDLPRRRPALTQRHPRAHLGLRM